MTDLDELLERFEELDDDQERGVILCCAVAGDDCTNTELMRRVNEAGFRSARGTKLSKDWNAMRARLIREGLLVNDTSRIRCPPTLGQALAQRAAEDGSYEALCQVIGRSTAGYGPANRFDRTGMCDSPEELGIHLRHALYRQRPDLATGILAGSRSLKRKPGWRLIAGRFWAQVFG
ncbi:MAG: hypothetical protein ACOCXA_03645, partial [Planctomycetota bacterium]